MPSARRASLLAFSLLAAAAAWSQTGAALKDSRAFFQDVAGYHAQGKAEAADRVEAQRLAKADALRRLFAEIGKDTIFAEMCLSGWPEYISVEDTVSTERDGKFAVQAQVAVATSAIMLTEQKYQNAVMQLLDTTEAAIAEVEKSLGEADGLEKNLQVPGALAAYRRAKTRLGEARELVKDVGDKSVTSGSGESIAAIGAKLDALSLRVTEGLGRMEAIEAEAQKSAAADETSKAFDLYDQALQDMESRGEEYVALSPFYDLPREKLDSILLGIQADRAKGATIVEELEKLRAAIPQDRQYLRQKADLDLADARALNERLEKLEAEVRLEIRTPRLVRQERAQRARAFLTAVGAGAKWAFLHKPLDIVTFTWDLPLRWDMENPIESTGEANVRLEAEGLLGGLWVRGGLGHDDVTGGTGTDEWRTSAWQSSFDLGFGRKTVVGLGASWDWKRTVEDPAAATPPADAERELGFRIEVGGIDADRRRMGWQIALGYAVPMADAGELVVPYHLNASLSVRVKAADILILTAGIRTKAYQSAELADGVAFTDAFSYRFDWRLGIGLRLPPPFVIGLSFGGQITGGLTRSGDMNADPYVGGWGVSLSYVF
jgi:hypothetical protein